MINYSYSPAELKIIIDIANKNEIPISIGDDSVIIHSKWDLKPLMIFSKNGFNMPAKLGFNNLDYYRKIFMEEKVAFK